MHLKLFLIFMFVVSGANLHAQYVPTTWGSGVAMGSNQLQCAHEYKTSEMIVAGNKDVKAAKKELSRLKKEQRGLKKDVSKLKRDLSRNKRTLNNNFNRNIANLISDHLEEGRSASSYKSCSASNSSCTPIDVNRISNDRTETEILPPTNSGTSEEDYMREIRNCSREGDEKKIKRCIRLVEQNRNQGSSQPVVVERTVTDVIEVFSRRSSNSSSATSEDQAILNTLQSLRSLRSGSGSSSSGVGNYDTPAEMCIPYSGNSQAVLSELHAQDGSSCINVLKEFSNNDGTINPGICATELSIYNSRRDVSECRDAIEDMNGLGSDLQAKLMDLEVLDNHIEDAEAALKALEDDVFDQLVADGKILEADCENCETPVYREKPSMWSNVSQLLGLGLGAAAAYYTADKISDKNARLGWPSNPYLGVQVGFPFVMAGIYGGILGGQSHGGYGCAGGVGGIGGGAFGYPQGMFGGSVGGGMYMPGMGPWGMSGPWSGWGQMPGGFIGGASLIGGAMGGGYPGMMGGGYPGMMGGGYPGMGGYIGNIGLMGGAGYPGMMGGGYPGMMGGSGMMGNVGFLGGLGGGGIPGMMGGGIPGMMGGSGMMGNVGIAGSIGLPGMYGGGIPGMMGGGIPGMMGGGISGMMGGGGIAGGNSAYLQMQMQLMEQQQQQMQIQMETQMRKAQQQQQAMQTITTLAQQIQQLQMQINTTYQGLFSDSYIGGGGAMFNNNTLVNGIQLNSNLPTRPGSHR